MLVHKGKTEVQLGRTRYLDQEVTSNKVNLLSRKNGSVYKCSTCTVAGWPILDIYHRVNCKGKYIYIQYNYISSVCPVTNLDTLIYCCSSHMTLHQVHDDTLTGISSEKKKEIEEKEN